MWCPVAAHSLCLQIITQSDRLLKYNTWSLFCVSSNILSAHIFINLTNPRPSPALFNKPSYNFYCICGHSAIMYGLSCRLPTTWTSRLYWTSSVRLWLGSSKGKIPRQYDEPFTPHIPTLNTHTHTPSQNIEELIKKLLYSCVYCAIDLCACVRACVRACILFMV